MNKGLITRNVAIMLLFGALGLTRFSENVRTVQIVGLFFSGVACGVALGILVSALKSKQTQD